MKRALIISMVFVLITMMVVPAALAGRGYGPGNGACGACAGQLLACSSESEIIEGAVVGYGIRGGGLVVQTSPDSTEVVYGVGPVWYWQANGIDRPEVGETVTISAKTVQIGTETRRVIVSITIEGETLVLRDAATCLPLWR